MPALPFLDPERVVLLGGTSVVSEGIQEQVADVVPGVPVDRLAGADRYGTASADSAFAYPGWDCQCTSPRVRTFLTPWPGHRRPGVAGASMLLTRRGCAPQATADEVERLGAMQVVVLGGSGAVSQSAAQLTPVEREPLHGR